MTGPVSPEGRPGRSPGVILAGLLAVLLACAGVIVWDQTRTVTTPGTVTAPDSGPSQSAASPAADDAPAPAPAPAPTDSGSEGGYGDLK